MTYDELVAILRKRNPTAKPTGVKDCNGEELATGDIVQFYFKRKTDEFVTHGCEEDPGFTKMTDVVEEHEGQFYALCTDTFGGMFLQKIDGICKRVGDVHTNPEPLKQTLRFGILSAIGWPGLTN